MEVRIELKKWKIVEKDDKTKTKTIGGTFVVMCGATRVSETAFNDGYSSAEIAIPAQLMVEVEALDQKIKEHITKNFTG